MFYIQERKPCWAAAERGEGMRALGKTDQSGNAVPGRLVAGARKRRYDCPFHSCNAQELINRSVKF